MPFIQSLTPDEWRTLRGMRLSALHESPDAFLSTYAREESYGEREWRAEFVRGDWNIGFLDSKPVSLLGVTREPSMPAQDCFLEYLWVDPDYRRAGVARGMLAAVLDRLRISGIRTVFLWVLDGNEAAMRLYRQVGFVSTDHRQPLPADPERSEERMQLDFAPVAPADPAAGSPGDPG